MKDPSTLLEEYPSYFESLHYSRVTGENPKRRVFIFSQPRSGSTLLLRLLRNACMTNCVGDRAPIYYESILNLYEEIRDNQGLYGGSGLERGPFPDQYRGFTEKERELSNFHWNVSGLLFGNNYGSGFAKCTTIGFANDITSRFCEMLREIYQHDNLKIVWLRRDHDDIVKSLAATQHWHKECDNDTALALLEKQRKEQNESYRLGDIVVKYSDLVADPIKVLTRLNPMYAPYKPCVEDVMANVMK